MNFKTINGSARTDPGLLTAGTDPGRRYMKTISSTTSFKFHTSQKTRISLCLKTPEPFLPSPPALKL